jgi:hypothetical protein
MKDIVTRTWWASIHAKWLTSPIDREAGKVLAHSDFCVKVYTDSGMFVHKCVDKADYQDLVDCGFDWDVIEELTND